MGRISWWWLLAALPLLVGLGRLRLDVEILNLLPETLPEVQGLKLYQAHFANTRELIITLESDDPQVTEEAARSLAEELSRHTNSITDVSWQSPWLADPAGAAEFLAYLWLNQPPSLVDTLIDRLQPDNMEAALEQAKETLATSLSPEIIARLSYDPLQLTAIPAAESLFGSENASNPALFASTDGRFRLVFVQAPSNISDYRSSGRWFEQLQQTVTAWHSNLPASAASASASPTLTIAYTGQPAFMAEIGGGMERDLVRSVTGMFLVIAALFWLAHRTWIPLLKLLAMLALVLAGTLALGGLAFGELNVVSVGFAAMLLALAVDYGLVLYQEARISPGTSVRELQRTLGPGIWWAALTTSGAFLAASLAQLPGLVQMGLLVGAGILLSAAIMLYLFLPWNQQTATPPDTSLPFSTPPSPCPNAPRDPATLKLTAVLLVAALGLLTLTGLPKIEQGTEALRPLHSPAYQALETLKSRLGTTTDPLWLLTTASTDADMVKRLDKTYEALQQARKAGTIRGFTLPHGVWPNPAHQNENRSQLANSLPSTETLSALGHAAGFTDQSLGLAQTLLTSWHHAVRTSDIVVPTGQLSQWALHRMTSRSEETRFALGFVYPQQPDEALKTLPSLLSGDDSTWLTNWDALGAGLLGHVEHDLAVVLPLVAALLVLTLSGTFRRPTEILLGLGGLVLSLILLQATMRLAGWSWNLMNFVALPVLLGTGVDYSIHMQLALRRHAGNTQPIRRGVGRALLLCGATTIAGFASLTFSSNAGLASLGRICATGMALIVVTTVFLLPAWWRRCNNGNTTATASAPGPSRLYRAEVWRAGLFLVRLAPVPLLRLMAHAAASVLWLADSARRTTVTNNLSPLFPDQPALAAQKARKLYHQFAQKVVDLWLYESGRDITHLIGQLHGSEAFFSAMHRGKGVLLVTPHLGNWEFGGPILAKHDIQLLALTLAEPHQPLTQLRQDARARHGIETLVIQQDPFAFLEVVRRLDQGEVVALLVDRPPEAVATSVDFCGQAIAASVAPAELARASGCLILPVFLLRTSTGKYDAFVLRPIDYKRATLRSKEARQEVAQKILRAFEPVIRQHPDQWFHFVPIWSAPPATPSNPADRNSNPTPPPGSSSSAPPL